MSASNKVREQLAQQFLASLNQGQIPWKACWSQGRPENAVTGKTYRGVNAIALSYAADDRGYTDPRWCTYNQAQQNGWQVRKGETSPVSVEYWAYYDLKEKKLLSWQEMRDKLKADPDYEKHLQLRCRIYPVFNAQQIDGIPVLEDRRHTDIGTLRQQRDTLIRNMGIGYEEYGNRAFYSPSLDRVVLPPEVSFDDTYSYMATFLHECGHASGAAHRLNRDLSGLKGSESYAREELRAEIASAFTAQSLGLQLTPSQLEHHTQLHAAYVQAWAAILKNAPDELFRAIKAAEEISDYLIEKGEFDMSNKHVASHDHWRSYVGHIVENPAGYLRFAAYDNGKFAVEYHGGPDSFIGDVGTPEEISDRHGFAGAFRDNFFNTDYVMPPLTVEEREQNNPEFTFFAKEAIKNVNNPDFVYDSDFLEKVDRYIELQSCFWNETNDPETQEWREELSADEAAMVERWDLQSANGMSKLASDILERSVPAEQIMIAIESTDDYTDANFHAELIDMKNPNGSWGTAVDYYRLVKIGDSDRIEVLDNDLVFPTKAQAKAAAESIPYAQLVDYDTLVHEAGKNLTAKYTLEEIPGSSDLRLHFHGYGRIEGYSFPEARPWQPQVNRIREISIGSGITEIGRNVLNNYPAVEEITWPRSVTHSDPYALWNCPNLKEISFSGNLPGSVKAHNLTSPSVLLNLASRYPELTREQLAEIAEDLRDGVSWEEISVYAKPEFSAQQMNAIRYAARSGLTPDQINLIADPRFTPLQMDILRCSLLAGMSMEQVQRFANAELPTYQMLDEFMAGQTISQEPEPAPVTEGPTLTMGG